LGQVSGPIATHPSQLPTNHRSHKPITTAPLGGALGQNAAEMCIYELNGYDSERDYCIPEDERASSGSVYVSLVNNPERFTGYQGDHANAVWREIYRENCFEMHPQTAQEEIVLSKGHQSPGGSAFNDLEAVMSGRRGQRLGGATLDQEYNQLRLDNTCLEKRVFWRLISGMHTSISTHLCWSYLNQTTGQWVFSQKAFLIEGSKSRMLQIKSMEQSPMDREPLLQLRRRLTRRQKNLKLPRYLHILRR